MLAVSGSGAGRKDAPCGIDGRVNGLGSQHSFFEKPLISQSFRSRFRWSGLGTLDPEQQTRLRSLSKRVKEEGRLLRLWATPDTPEAWKTLLDCGVGLINTDQPTKAAKFVRELLPSVQDASGKSDFEPPHLETNSLMQISPSQPMATRLTEFGASPSNDGKVEFGEDQT